MFGALLELNKLSCCWDSFLYDKISDSGWSANPNYDIGL